MIDGNYCSASSGFALGTISWGKKFGYITGYL